MAPPTDASTATGHRTCIRLAQDIERKWEEKEERLDKIRLLRGCLARLHDHKDRNLVELSWLAPKMKSLDFSLKHFLVLFLPIERKHTRGLRDDQFLITTTDAVSSNKVCWAFTRGACSVTAPAMRAANAFIEQLCCGVSPEGVSLWGELSQASQGHGFPGLFGFLGHFSLRMTVKHFVILCACGRAGGVYFCLCLRHSMSDGVKMGYLAV